ncbi:MAG: peptide chain release factor N(5)-glutamine methyltransferase [Gemmatimonadaceae bacterium]|nr:peptide chain release factor N(5)-glutamine methyltransferase [Gemmatimonadaceae bacterium]
MSGLAERNAPSSAQHGAEPTFGELVRGLARMFAAAGIPQAGTEARDLVAAVLDKPRFWPALHANEHPLPDEASAIREAARRRTRGAPMQYAVRRAAFRFLSLRVDERVLIPRPETEQLVELVLASTQARRGGIAADVGTGSGAIALALAAEGRFERIIATDLSLDALGVARENHRLVKASLRAPVEWRAGSALAPLRGTRVDVLVSNPPYIAYTELPALPANVRNWEPTQALCCSGEGLAVTREIVAAAPDALQPRGLLALEVDATRAHAVAALMESSGGFEQVAVHRDFSGRDRFVLATRRGGD